MSFGGGANATQSYTVNGIRIQQQHRQPRWIRTSSIIGCNCGTMITLNNDMVQEVKVQSSNFSAEYGTGGMNVSAVTKGGSSQIHGTGYWYGRDHRLAANDRSNSILGVPKPKSGYFYPGGNVGGPIALPRAPYTSSRDKLFFWVASKSQRQKVDSGSTPEHDDERGGARRAI